MASPDPRLSVEEYKHRGDLNQATTRENIATMWTGAIVWSSFWLGLFGFLSCLAVYK